MVEMHVSANGMDYGRSERASNATLARTNSITESEHEPDTDHGPLPRTRRSRPLPRKHNQPKQPTQRMIPCGVCKKRKKRCDGKREDCEYVSLIRYSRQAALTNTKAQTVKDLAYAVFMR